ncbi:MBL fold metallo-hydrolase [Candidatus Woesebacteria bacterium]|nr:MBL fold metallo-hydrolase [Candidatus Woesebacteria bacterium]MCD8507350.1 MBL fold metallo-hydrolase [Candidatus Woesebacteria bacterium]MCD8526977.1 MBL fold metallo-hydrolase [Candidatus Woesebacteria bacterium]MCD8546783.1 MBL fold metallo-hydrolase [Candidatus Woesebacteria bacterium]
MDIQYVGHSCFRLRGKEGIVITDPFQSSVGFSMPALRADVVTLSHDHGDHNHADGVKATASRENPFVIREAGEYEVGGITVFGYPSWHDDQKGEERGRNIMYSIFLDDVHVLHLGDLGHKLDQKTIEAIPAVDVLLCPVGGIYTINAKVASEVISSLEPATVIPMHYRTDQHDTETFGELATVEDFMKEYGKTAQPQDKLRLTGGKAAEETETELVVLDAKVTD